MQNPLKYKKIFIAGHRGMVGSALVRYLKKQGAKKLIKYLHSILKRAIFNPPHMIYITFLGFTNNMCYAFFKRTNIASFNI